MDVMSYYSLKHWDTLSVKKLPLHIISKTISLMREVVNLGDNFQKSFINKNNS